MKTERPISQLEDQFQVQYVATIKNRVLYILSLMNMWVIMKVKMKSENNDVVELEILFRYWESFTLADVSASTCQWNIQHCPF